MLDWVNSHGLEVLAIYYVLSSAIGAMPTPASGGSAIYAWLYSFLHGVLQAVAANWMRIAPIRNLVTSTAPPEK